MNNYRKKAVGIAAANILLFLLIGLLSYEQRVSFTAEAGELECIEYDGGDNTITVNCNASFLDVVQTINDSEILENLGNGEYILNATLEVDDGITFEMTSNGAIPILLDNTFVF